MEVCYANGWKLLESRQFGSPSERAWCVGIRFDFRVVDCGKEYVATIEAKTITQTEILRRHMENCDRIHHPGGACNVEDFREAGHSVAEMGRKIGEKVGADVEQYANTIHKSLRTKPA